MSTKKLSLSPPGSDKNLSPEKYCQHDKGSSSHKGLSHGRYLHAFDERQDLLDVIRRLVSLEFDRRATESRMTADTKPQPVRSLPFLRRSLPFLRRTFRRLRLYLYNIWHRDKP